MKTTKADTWFSRFIRIRDAFESNGTLVNKCFTCGKPKQAKELECGHYQSRKHINTRWSELNALPQCTYCNKWKYGEAEKMAIALDLKFGTGTAEKMRTEARKPTKQNETLISDYYRNLVNNIITQKNWKHLKWW